jgi:hypothetical protein
MGSKWGLTLGYTTITPFPKTSETYFFCAGVPTVMFLSFMFLGCGAVTGMPLQHPQLTVVVLLIRICRQQIKALYGRSVI